VSLDDLECPYDRFAEFSLPNTVAFEAYHVKLAEVSLQQKPSPKQLISQSTVSQFVLSETNENKQTIQLRLVPCTP